MDRAPETFAAPMPVILPPRPAVLSRMGWTAFIVALIVVCAVAG